MDTRPVFFLLSVLVAASLADKLCCYPDQFEIEIGSSVGASLHGRGSLRGGTTQMGFDYTNKRVGEFITMYEESKLSHYQVIYDINAHAEFLINAKERRCQKYEYRGPMDHCVNKNATFSMSMYLGDKKLTVDSFSFPFKRGQAVGQAYQSVSQGDCLPNSLIFQGMDGEADVFSLDGFFNYVHGIQDPAKYFSVPDYCPKSFSEEPRMYVSSPLPRIF